MTYVDDELARFHAAFDPQPEADPWAGWRAVAVIAAVCAVALAVVGLGRTALDDVGIAGASPASADDEFYAWYSASPRNASYFHLRDEFGTGRVGDQAVRVAQCESELNPRAVSPTNDHGVMQLNARYHRAQFERVTGVAWSPNVYHASYNAAYAKWLWSQQGWGPWTCRGAA